MKKIFCLILLTGIITSAFAQSVAINNSNSVADPSAILDISSTTKGMLIPRMRTNERTAIALPQRGLMVYDVDTQSFWFFGATGWKELLKSGDPLTPGGVASGDLYGTYPAPNVGKIQNLDVAFGVPNDKQILKWDAINNRWQGLNDSLFLPYNVSFGNPTKLFGITNTNTTNGATAVYGKSGAGSGIAPALTLGVWGDNANGAGILGTSANGVGTYGYSVNNYGSYGYSGHINYSGVYGWNGAGGTGVMGEVYGAGIAVAGKSNGTIGKAAIFRNTHTSNTDTVVSIQHDGIGRGVYIGLNNASNATEALSIKNAGVGQTIDIANTNAANASTMINANYNGTGYGMMIYASNTTNTLPALLLQHLGPGSGIEAYAYKGKAGLFQVQSSVNSSDALKVGTIGTGSAADISITNASSSSTAVEITTNGTGRGLDVTLSNVSNLAAAIHASSPGNKAIEAFAQGTAILGQTTGLTGGVAVLAQSSLNSADGIGVKGISYSTGVNSSTAAAVMGINSSDGTAIYGEATGGGVAVYGKASRINGAAIYAYNDASQGQALRGSSIGTDGIGLYAEAGNSSSQSIAGYFRNNYISNTRDVLKVVTNGLGKPFTIQNTSSSNTGEMIRVQNYGTGNFFTLIDELSDTKASIAKNGNIATDGTLTVKNGKGIVRNSTGLQLRTEILTVNVPAGSISHYDQFNASIDVTVTFSTAFSSVPMVLTGNTSIGSYSGLTSEIINLTTTGCTFRLVNYTGNDWSVPASTVKLLAIGAE